jgi:hypothetical protein
MFVDPGIGLLVAERVNRWLRNRRQARGVSDAYFRGVRMTYNRSYRIAMCMTAVFLLGLAGVLYFVPGILEEKSRFWVVVVKVGWVGITAVAILAPLQAFREFAVVTDDGVIKSSLWGAQTRLDWREIDRVRTKPNENGITFQGSQGTKLKMSLCYDGWEDFCELGQRHLAPHLLYAIRRALADEGPGKPRKS